ncbi:unnamed protein product [Strongylus vulgaris]|uniref:Uncharacterized protein n=1 Tax=Strongylus vulgaris TaxID=40348 RepID=A0A3P7JXP4_STRVU|nr:unnamed protein product [Strongylus vulgaris]
MTAADTRELLVSQMGAHMHYKDREIFDEMFPAFHYRHDFNEVKVEVGTSELKRNTSCRLTLTRKTLSGERLWSAAPFYQAINDELEDLGMAPVHIENWTKDERAFIDVDRNVCSTLMMELVVTARMESVLPLAPCPCISLMGPGQIRMRSNGRIDIRSLLKRLQSVVPNVTSDCPSKFVDRGRKVPW